MGDINISPEDCDIGIGEPNRLRWLKTGRCSFLPEEREWLATLKNWGLVDSFRHLNPSVNDRFSWFDYRSRGFEDEPKRGLRIDVILATAALQARFKDAGIDYELRGMEKPSDHAPIWLELNVPGPCTLPTIKSQRTSAGFFMLRAHARAVHCTYCNFIDLSARHFPPRRRSAPHVTRTASQ